MRYIISRTSMSHDDSSPCEDAISHESACSWGPDGDFEDHGTFWTIEAKDIEELYEKFGQLVVQSPARRWQDPDAPKIEVEIYDGWRE